MNCDSHVRMTESESRFRNFWLEFVEFVEFVEKKKQKKLFFLNHELIIFCKYCV